MCQAWIECLPLHFICGCTSQYLPCLLKSENRADSNSISTFGWSCALVRCSYHKQPSSASSPINVDWVELGTLVRCLWTSHSAESFIGGCGKSVLSEWLDRSINLQKAKEDHQRYLAKRARDLERDTAGVPSS